MRALSLKYRLLLSTAVPGLIIVFLSTAILIWVFVSHQNTQEESHQLASAHLLSVYAAPLLINSRTQDVKQLGSAGMNIPQLRSLTLFNADFKAVHHFGPIAYDVSEGNWSPALLETGFDDDNQQALQIETEHSFRYLVPIINNIETADSKPGSVIGWLDVEFSRQQHQLILYKALLALTVISLAIFTITSAITYYTLKNSIEPISSMIRQLDVIGERNLDGTVESCNIEEFDALGAALNKLLQKLQQIQLEMQEHIDNSTRDLRETLETIEIQNIELDLARKEAVQASRIKSEFLANTSHEIRTPLNGIIGFTRLLLKNNADPQQREYLTTIQQSSENLLNIINDILDLSKIEAGKLLLDYLPFSIHDITEDVLQILSPGAHEKGLELVNIIAENVPENLHGDPHRIKQILTNLISNAIKFSNSGNIIVRITSEPQHNGQVIITFSVTDSGVGIANQHLDNSLFNAFTQVETGMNRQHGGTGLGLAISKKLVDQMGGKIGIESKQEVGSTFWFMLRFDINQDEQEANTNLNQDILLFDGNTASHEHIATVMNAAGARIFHLDNSNDIIPALTSRATSGAERQYDALIISIPIEHSDFPLDSLNTLIQKAGTFCKTIVYTTAALKQQLSESLGPDVLFLTKPARRDKLFRVLQNPNTADTTALMTDPVMRAVSILPEQRREILCVDDNPANLKLITTLLNDLGHKTHAATSGHDAITLCEQHTFDIIFMDIQMPGMDGIETTKRIRSMRTNNNHIPIIALTAHALFEQKQQMLLAGLDDYLSKPTNEKQLSKVIERWCTQDYASTTENFDCVDIQLSLQLSNNKPDLAADMLNMLLSELAGNQNEINQALDDNNYNEAIELVHKLHGATCYCGVPALKDACKTLEIELKQQQAQYSKIAVQNFNQCATQLLSWHEQHDVAALFSH